MEANEESKPLLSFKPQDARKKQNYTFLYLCYLVSLLGSLSLGMTLGITSPLIPGIQQDKGNNTPHLDANEASWFGGFLAPGAMIGGLVAGCIAQRIGRKKMLTVAAVPYIIGLVVIASSIHTWTLFVGRFITGIGAGITSSVILLYVGEITPSNIRGIFLSGLMLFASFGTLLVYGIGIVLPWRWLSGVAALPPTFLLLFSIFIVESPRYFVSKNDSERVKRSLQRLRGANANIEKEYEEMEASYDFEVKAASWKEIITEKSLRTPTLLVLVLMYFQIFTGFDCILFFSKSLFLRAGFVGYQLTLALLSLPVTLVLFHIVECLIIDRVGRKALLIVSGTLMALSLTTFGLYFYLTNSQDLSNNGTSSFHTTTSANTTFPNRARTEMDLTWMALISMVIYIAAFSIGIGPVPKTFVGEMLPLRARGKAAGFIVLATYTFVFLSTSCFSYMLKSFSPQGTFWFFAANSVVAVVFTIFCLPETKGKTLEEIEEHFRG